MILIIILNFRDLDRTHYAYRVDGVNLPEYYHFKTATKKERPFRTYILRMLKMKYGRIGQGFREAFRDAPRATHFCGCW